MVGGQKVAPFTGAWIETFGGSGTTLIAAVAPFTGAWIETSTQQLVFGLRIVAPFTGAWIETAGGLVDKEKADGRTLHGCVD